MASGGAVITAIRKKLRAGGQAPTEAKVAAHLAMHPTQLAAFKNRDALTPLQIANLVQRAGRVAAERVLGNLIRPVVEFFPLDASLNERGGVHYDLFDVVVDGQAHPYRAGLKKELQEKSGIYIFYDSRGRALYAGKAKAQKLWEEMRAAFNRDRQNLQTLNRVQHPEKRISFKPSDEKARQIVPRTVPLAELSRYFSAYQIPSDFIDDMEAFLIRAFPNDLLNKKKEKLSKKSGKAVAE